MGLFSRKKKKAKEPETAVLPAKKAAPAAPPPKKELTPEQAQRLAEAISWYMKEDER